MPGSYTYKISITLKKKNVTLISKTNKTKSENCILLSFKPHPPILVQI